MATFDINAANAAQTYTLQNFINMKEIDVSTYRNFSILEKYNNIEFVDHCLLDEYEDVIKKVCVTCELTNDEFRRYKYSPDLLAYDVYGSTQLDFLILFANGLADPKDFDMDIIQLPYKSILNDLLSEILSSNKEYIEQTREYYAIV